MPQPLSKLLKRTKTASMSWGKAGHYALEDHPELLKLAMRVITDWAALESRVNEIIIGILKANATPALAMLTVLTSASARQAALIAAAETALSERELKILKVMTERFTKLAKQRNNIAHGRWANINEAPNGILLFSPKVVTQFALWDGMMRFDQSKIPAIGYDAIFIYKANDFVEITKRIGKLSKHFQALEDLLNDSGPQREKLLAELSIQLGISAK